MTAVAAFTPAEIAKAIETRGVTKANAPTAPTFVLGILAGAFIALGAVLATVIGTDSTLGAGPTRWLAGIGFSVGLILVVIAGAELFTGNNLIAMAWASGLVGTREVVRSWLLVYAGNVVGCLGTVVFAIWGDLASLGGGAVGATAVEIAQAKAGLSLGTAFARGVLCNALVCLAVWLAMGGRSVTDRILGILFPITAFVAIGLEHSIANWFFLPFGLALDPSGAVSGMGVARNLVAVTAGNLAGGTLLVAGVYWLAYLRRPR
jgi:formate/nitrite transporter